ncbi:MAG: type II/IV secretion system ATPase subunit [Candidatus Pacearchaeota archaeon]|nr:MAG: type II/IV secretion system ATPase subunit [Candidatus Pacearchaeota archaeon]
MALPVPEIPSPPKPEHPVININPEIPVLRRVEDKTKINIRYILIAPHATAHIYWNKKSSELIYEVEEPILNEFEKKTLEEIESGMLELINLGAVIEKTQEALLSYIDKMAKLILNELGRTLSEESYSRIFYYLYRDFIGLNETEPLLRDFFIEDIECNGVNTPVYIVHRLYRNMKTNLTYKNIKELASFVEKLAQRCGRYISYATPLLDGTLPDGSRVNATYTTEITSRGPTFTIRKFTKVPWTPIQLISMNTLSPEMLAYFWILMQYKANILITGGTGSGKTSMLNALAFFIPPEARVVSVEDTREINLPRENWLPSVARAGLAGAGEIDMFTLLKESFRQNPDYVIVGEVRGKEAFVLFQAMAAGHPSLSTMHADSVETVIRRLETPPINLSPTLVNSLDAVAVMTHALVDKEETRRLREVIEVVDVTAEGIALTNTPFMWNPSEDSFYFKTESKVFEKIQKRYGLSKEQILREFKIRTKLLFALYKKRIYDFSTVQKMINEYYKNPKAVLSKYVPEEAKRLK